MQQLSKLTDDQLVASYAKGDNAAFDMLLSRHQEKVHNYIFHMVKDEDLAEDIFQETFVKAITTIRQNRYSGDGKFAAWITRIAHNLIIDHFRQAQGISTVSTDNVEANVLNRRDLSEGSIEDDMIESQILSDVKNLVVGLPADQKAVVEMRFYENMSFKEIAQRTGVSINTALGRMRYAILNMRRRAKEANIALSI
ncbi:MAG: sigma-70 family RNA polymerase sigma factor [Bacteroides sp.]|nr:sigma-70 family RNA polymerase sigma factor [Bacteroides sp.]MCM1458287.1 sigma-70 family RNA polymerase sigma factor [Lachnoclostridium sp.]